MSLEIEVSEVSASQYCFASPREILLLRVVICSRRLHVVCVCVCIEAITRGENDGDRSEFVSGD